MKAVTVTVNRDVSLGMLSIKFDKRDATASDGTDKQNEFDFNELLIDDQNIAMVCW